MSEDRRFEATRTRLERARRDGDVPRSSDLVAAMALASGSAAVFLSLVSLAGAARAALIAAAGSSTWSPLPYATLAVVTFGVAAFSGAGAVAASLLQTGRLSFSAINVRWTKLDPAAGLRRVFSRDAGLAGLKALAVAAAVGGAIFPVVRDASGSAAAMETPPSLAWRTAAGLRQILMAAAAVGLGCALLDAISERTKWRRRLRMSFDELKRDQRQSEGDPLFRSRRRSAHRALLRGSIERVKEAAFVVVNPSHVAVALAYRPPKIPVPQVLLRAVDRAALEVRRRAAMLGIPVIEDAALARSLLESTAIDQFIPKEAYVPVARIVAALLESSRLNSSGPRAK